MRKPYAIIALLLFLAGCAHIEYVGNEYPPTTIVDLFYAEKDVRISYTVIGRVVATGDAWVSTKKLRKELIKKARRVGADGVIIYGLDRYREQPTTTYTETTTTEKKGGKLIKTTTSTASTEAQEIKKITAVFIRYK